MASIFGNASTVARLPPAPTPSTRAAAASSVPASPYGAAVAGSVATGQAFGTDRVQGDLEVPALLPTGLSVPPPNLAPSSIPRSGTIPPPVATGQRGTPAPPASPASRFALAAATGQGATFGVPTGQRAIPAALAPSVAPPPYVAPTPSLATPTPAVSTGQAMQPATNAGAPGSATPSLLLVGAIAVAVAIFVALVS